MNKEKKNERKLIFNIKEIKKGKGLHTVVTLNQTDKYSHLKLMVGFSYIGELAKMSFSVYDVNRTSEQMNQMENKLNPHNDIETNISNRTNQLSCATTNPSSFLIDKALVYFEEKDGKIKSFLAAVGSYSELVTYGYIRTQCDQAVPAELCNLIRNFYSRYARRPADQKEQKGIINYLPNQKRLIIGAFLILGTLLFYRNQQNNQQQNTAAQTEQDSFSIQPK